MKKIFSVVLAALIVTVLSLCATFSVSAAGKTQIVISDAVAQKGDIAEVPIVIKNNPGIASVKLTITFPVGLTLLSPVKYDIASVAGLGMQPEHYESPFVINWISGDANVTGDQTIATLSFKVSDKATPGDKVITATYKADDIYALDGKDKKETKNIAVDIVSGKISVTEDGAAVLTTGEEPAAVGEIADADGQETEIGVTTLDNGKGDPESGEYTGGEVIFDGGEVESNEAKSEEEEKASHIWIYAVVASLLLIAAVVLVILKKRADKQDVD